VPDDVAALSAQLTAAVEVAAEAGRLALAYRHRDVEWLEKSSSTDLVTEADRAVEALVVRRLAAAFPDDQVVAEEGAEGTVAAADPGRRRWYVDPIDGTTNYLKGLPAWGVSLGLADGEDQLLLGVVVMPALDQVHTAVRGGGARRNGVPIRAVDLDRLDRCLISYGLTPRTPEHWGPGIGPGILALAGAALGTRVQGCSVADLTSVATGLVDATVAGGMSPWDVAAGVLICLEAGLRLSTPAGDPVTGPAPAFIASPPGVHDAIRAVLAEAGALPAG
jgi:myo-inositol-1(or 4)-monophosphatase